MTQARPMMGYVVDFQNDFVLRASPGGRLHVRHLADPSDVAGAEKVIPAMLRLVHWMAATCDLTMFTADGHRSGDEEIRAAVPNFVNTYPEHCLAYSDDASERAGADLVDGLPKIPDDRRVLRDASRSDAVRAARRAIEERSSVFVEKSVFDVWTGNPAMDAFMTTIDEALQQRPEIIAAGVAGDVCVAQGLEGFFERGYDVTVVTDAVYTLGGNDEELFAKWAARGAQLTTVEELESRLVAQSVPLPSSGPIA